MYRSLQIVFIGIFSPRHPRGFFRRMPIFIVVLDFCHSSHFCHSGRSPKETVDCHSERSPKETMNCHSERSEESADPALSCLWLFPVQFVQLKFKTELWHSILHECRLCGKGILYPLFPHIYPSVEYWTSFIRVRLATTSLGINEIGSTLEPDNILYFSDYQIIHSILIVI